MPSLPTLQLLLAALSGAAGALVIRIVLRLYLRFRESKNPLAIYYCGERSPTPGGLDHGWGQVSKSKGPSGRITWLYTEEPTDKVHPREHTLFGPYVNDLGRPGYYRVAFSICAKTFSPDSDNSVLLLDVVQAPFGGTTTYVLHGQRLIREGELARSQGKYLPFYVEFYAPGTGVYEYRARVFGGNVSSDQSIEFDTIKVFRNPPLWEVF